MGHGPEQDAAQLKNAIIETSRGIPFIARAYFKTPHYNTGVATAPGGRQRPPRPSLIYPACAFLIAQGPYCYFGASSGWTDAGWQWHGEYDWVVGTPVAPATQDSAYTWSRGFAHANVTIDVKASHCSLRFHNGTVVQTLVS